MNFVADTAAFETVDGTAVAADATTDDGDNVEDVVCFILLELFLAAGGILHFNPIDAYSAKTALLLLLTLMLLLLLPIIIVKFLQIILPC